MAKSQATPKLKDSACVLVVEGYGDLLFYAEALEFLGFHGRVFIKEFTGAADLLVKIETFLNAELLAEKVAIAVILDADSNPVGRIQSLSNLLKKITNRKLEHGVWSKEVPKEANLGFFVVPDGKQQGEVETLVWKSWANDPQNAVPKQCIDQYLSCMAQAGLKANSPDKGKVGALLSVKCDEDPRLGPGARHKVFDFSRPEFEDLLKFLRGFAS